MGVMHHDEKVIDDVLVANLLNAQFPQWSALPRSAVKSAGTDNALFRLGDDMVIRLPRVAWATGQGAKEHRWLPELAPHLTTTISQPIALGAPTSAYPWQWSIQRWIEGVNAIDEDVHDDLEFATNIGRFVREFHAVTVPGGPRAGAHNFGRGTPLADRNEATLAAIDASTGYVDARFVRDAWLYALNLPVYRGDGVWVHGDLAPGNILVHRGQLAAVIDFGALGIGDPAVDMMIAWNYLSPRARQCFRQVVAVDENTWLRGQAWALTVAIIQLPYYYNTNRTIRDVALSTIDAVLSDGALR